MKFTEEKLEQAFTELLEQQGYTHHLGESIVPNIEDVLIEADLESFLMAKYAHEGITLNEIKSIILQLKSLPASDLYESNKTFLRMLSDGFILKREDRSKKDIYIQFIDYAGLDPQRQPDPDQHPSGNEERQPRSGLGFPLHGGACDRQPHADAVVGGQRRQCAFRGGRRDVAPDRTRQVRRFAPGRLPAARTAA